MSDDKKANPRARPSRQAVDFENRRRRTGVDRSYDSRQPVDLAQLDTKNFVYRHINDEPGRMGALTQRDDYDVVSEEEAGGPVRHFVGYHPDGSPMYSLLCRKPRAFHAADQREKIERIRAEEQELLRRAPTADNPGDVGKGYVKPELNSLRHGSTRTPGVDGPPVADEHDA